MSRVKLIVRDAPCREHPGSEWFTLAIEGNVILSICTVGLAATAAHLRGKDLIQIGGAYDYWRRGVALRVRELPCVNHPTSDWLILSDNGDILLSCCVDALNELASLNRGRDILNDPSDLSAHVINLMLLHRSRLTLADEEAAPRDESQRYPVNPHV